MQIFSCIVISTTISLLFNTPVASASDNFITSPLPVRNMYPPMMRFLDPVPDSALREYSNWDFKLDQHLANVNQMNQSPVDHLMVDMELYIADVTVRKSLSSDMDISVLLSLQRPFNGIMDTLIKGVHSVFKTPNVGRQSRPNYAFDYHLNTGNNDTSWQGKNRWEMGNIVLSLRKQVMEGDGWAIAALSSIKLPTASQRRGWSSGKADLGLGSVASINSDSWFMHIEGWYIHPFAKDAPGERFIPIPKVPPPFPAYILGWQYKSYVRGSSTLGWKYSDTLSLIMQLQGGTSPYDSGITPLDNAPLLVSFGLQAESESGLGWSVIFTENGLSQLTTQDISFSLSLHYLFPD